MILFLSAFVFNVRPNEMVIVALLGARLIDVVLWLNRTVANCYLHVSRNVSKVSFSFNVREVSFLRLLHVLIGCYVSISSL